MEQKCFIQNGYNSEAASEAYFNRYPERRQPNMSIFGRLKENLVEYGGFNKPRPKNYRIQDAEDVAINVVGMVVCNKKSKEVFNCDSCKRSFCTNCSELTPEEIRCLTLRKIKLIFLCPDCETGLREIHILKQQVTELKEEIRNMQWRWAISITNPLDARSLSPTPLVSDRGAGVDTRNTKKRHDDHASVQYEKANAYCYCLPLHN
ncbi:hypothetical protein NQ318_012747 [Aromia moschata]|uniref:DUF4817 domain-containing protein n=1 Tax=Aromia moschata TaxID=1265417 RepID=A0AAV8XKU8_9CUCU|nr:hypothetical protein NQ318_012747 [Aromia moschata]